MKISIITPVYNEERNLPEAIAKLAAVEFPCDVEFLVIDDKSTDRSFEIIQQQWGEDPRFVIAQQTKNQGKGSAIQVGIEKATGDIIGIHDADFEYDPNDLPKLAQDIIDDKADIVYGSRFKKNQPQVHRTLHYLVNRFLTLVSNALSGLYLSDMETCYKLFRAEILKALPLECRRFGFEPEVTAKVAKLNVRIFEYPISYFPRTYLEGKKITWKDGVAALYYLFKFNFAKLTPETLDRLPERYRAAGRQWL